MSSKRNRKTLNLETKIQILDRLREGHGPAAVGREFNVGESTVRGIKSIESKIRCSVTAGASISQKKTSHARSPLIEKMEKMLMIWIEDKNQKHMPLNGLSIRLKAKRIYDHIAIVKQHHQKARSFHILLLAKVGWIILKHDLHCTTYL